MFAIHQMGAWTKRCLKYLTTDSGDWPTRDEIFSATNNADDVVNRLNLFRRRIPRDVPRRIDVIPLIDNVLQALRDDHGGMLPDEFLQMWYRKFSKRLNDQSLLATLDEKETMILVWKRWKDIDRLNEEFWAFGMRDKRYDITGGKTITEERVLQLERCLQDWLQKRRDD